MRGSVSKPMALLAGILLAAVLLGVATRLSTTDEVNLKWDDERRLVSSVSTGRDPVMEGIDLDWLESNSEYILLVRCDQYGRAIPNATRTQVEILEVFKGSASPGDTAVLIEPSHFRPDYLAIDWAYSPMHPNGEYLVFAVKTPETSKYAGCLMPVDRTFSKFSLSEWQGDIVSDESTTYADVVNFDIVSESREVVDFYLELKRVVLGKYLGQ